MIHNHTRIKLAIITISALGIAGATFVCQAKEYPKRAPFTGARWEEHEPVIKIGKESFTLVSLDGFAARDIVAFSRRTYEDKWRKRFEEGLVVLAGMGHESKDTVLLVVLPRAKSTIPQH